ncbi:MAG: exodeoxyribonuclease VII small subunit [Clostridia bacterium]|nr:exodeoxyribonuclease VII small subunit [Clostridia bacterium]
MEELSFEESMKQLEEIVTNLERGNLSLEDAISTFEKGIKLSKVANEKLEKAEKKINILCEGENGELKEEIFTTNEE